MSGCQAEWLGVDDLSPFSIKRSIEGHLDRLLPRADLEPQPLHGAMRYAVLSGGKRIRPLLLLHVAHACGANKTELELATQAACAVEFIHSASLVHDDLPCFDDAKERRGLPTVHARYGEALAVLVGDALLARAFEVLAEVPPRLYRRALRLLRLFGQAAGSSSGIIGGQSLEQFTVASGSAPGFALALIERYHNQKTAALFRLAMEAGAVAAGSADAAAWAAAGGLVGAWYQLADDLIDTRGQGAIANKPVRRDAALGRPNAVLCRGEEAVRVSMGRIFDELKASIRQLARTPEPLIGCMDALYNQVMLAVDL